MKPRAVILGILAGGVGGAVAIAVMELLSATAAFPLMLIPFATSIVLVMAFHPPAGIDPLVVVSHELSWMFVVAPVAAGALLLAAFAFLWPNMIRRGSWPARRW